MLEPQIVEHPPLGPFQPAKGYCNQPVTLAFQITLNRRQPAIQNLADAEKKKKEKQTKKEEDKKKVRYPEAPGTCEDLNGFSWLPTWTGAISVEAKIATRDALSSRAEFEKSKVRRLIPHCRPAESVG